MAEKESRYRDDNELNIELENRIKNLMWTVSGNYDLNAKLDIESFKKSKYIALYDAIKQGAFDKYFDREALALYLAKKIFLQADENMLMIIAQLCVDAASYKKIISDRSGVQNIRKKAFEDISEYQFETLVSTMMGRVKLAVIHEYLYGNIYRGEKNVEQIVSAVRLLEDASDTAKIIETIDMIYNQYIDKKFEKKYGDLDAVLAVTMEELYNSDWADYLQDEIYSDAFEKYLDNITNTLSNLSVDEENDKQNNAGHNIIYIDEEALKKMHTYVELNYGRSYLNRQEEERLKRTLCRGNHVECKLHFTDGILHSAVQKNYQYMYAQKSADKNKMAYYDHHRVVKRNIAVLTEILKRSLVMRNQTDYAAADSGMIIPAKLWRVNRTAVNKLFKKEIKSDDSDFVVELLIDASGSQSPRQAKVAMQAYIISEALSNVNIAHRVMSFCSFWDYTIMRRFRDYDEERTANARIFEYTTSSNNRDGLAVKAAVDGLLKRKEENKILILLSDGKPNDMNINHPKNKNPKPYSGEYAISDTALEIRKARGAGICVLGVFAGEEKDLAAEKIIFGKDFAYIRNIGNFSNVVGLYLRKQIDL